MNPLSAFYRSIGDLCVAIMAALIALMSFLGLVYLTSFYAYLGVHHASQVYPWRVEKRAHE